MLRINHRETMKSERETRNKRLLLLHSAFSVQRSAFSLCVSASSLLLALMSGCVQQMASQPHLRPLQQSAFFEHGQSARPIVPGTVQSGYMRNNARLEESTDFAPNAQDLPFPLTREVLERGRERFNIYCAACHAETGTGDGMIVQRGFSHPPSFHTDALRADPVGHFYDVMTRGFGAMPSYAAQIRPADRWSIAAYIRALQLSQHANVGDVPAENRGRLEQGGGNSR